MVETLGFSADGSSGGDCRHPLTGLGAIIINAHHEVLLMRRGTNPETVRNERGRWEFPGGELEWEEPLEQGICREVREEIGGEFKVLQRFASIDDIMPEVGQHWTTNPFLGVLLGDAIPFACEPHKCDEVRWFALHAMPEGLSRVTVRILEEHGEEIGLCIRLHSEGKLV